MNPPRATRIHTSGLVFCAAGGGIAPGGIPAGAGCAAAGCAAAGWGGAWPAAAFAGVPHWLQNAPVTFAPQTVQNGMGISDRTILAQLQYCIAIQQHGGAEPARSDCRLPAPARAPDTPNTQPTANTTAKAAWLLPSDHRDRSAQQESREC